MSSPPHTHRFDSPFLPVVKREVGPEPTALVKSDRAITTCGPRKAQLHKPLHSLKTRSKFTHFEKKKKKRSKFTLSVSPCTQAKQFPSFLSFLFLFSASPRKTERKTENRNKNTPSFYSNNEPKLPGSFARKREKLL